MTPIDERRGGFETRPYETGRSADAADIAGHIARLERLLEQELAAEEAVRAELGALPRSRAEAEKTARTLANLTQTLHALQRLRASLPAQTGPDDHDDMPRDDDDDMPRDIDQFRLDLARRIDAWVASRTDTGHAHGDSGTTPVEEAG